MSLPEVLQQNLRLPVVAAPMFLTSGPELVVACCTAGIVGTFPALNRRTTAEFEAWVVEIQGRLQQFRERSGREPAPFGVNLIVHKSNPRLEADLEVCERYRVPLIITSLGAASSVVDRVHRYGGVVFHDIINVRHARKAAEAGVDGLIAVAAGAGGHAGSGSPFALVGEIRRFFDKTLLLAGAISSGRDIAAAQLLGADLAYMGTRFIATREARVADAYKAMIVGSAAADIIYTPAISGVNANFLRPSIEAAGLDPSRLETPAVVDFGSELIEAHAAPRDKSKPSPWRDVWSAGQGVGAIDDVPPVAELVERLQGEYRAAVAGFTAQADRYR
jgi:nitronate monooxygenase